MWVLLAVVLWGATFAGEYLPSFASGRWFFVVSAGMCLVLLMKGNLSSVVVLGVVLVAGLAGGASGWHSAAAPIEGLCDGVATLRSDPELFSAGTAVVLELDNRRYRVSAYGMAGRRLAQRLSGQSVYVSGTCGPLTGNFARIDRVKHIVGRMNVDEVSENFLEGTHFIRAANRMRGVITQGSQSMSREYRSLFLGLVMGDDREQPEEMVQRFRQSGLSHLCAVSGQNVAFLLLLIRPLTSRRPRFVSWGITIGVIAWFVVVTRGEPSITRAAVMAGMVATYGLLGKEASTRTVLACTVMVLLMIDPMLAWSVGFALSVGATAGLAWLAVRTGEIFSAGQTLASTFAAQVGTTPVSLLVFGTVPVVSLVANPLAIPVAGIVMTIGLPLAVLAAVFPVLADPVGVVLTMPVAWVDAVARFSSAIAPTGWLHAVAWTGVLIVVFGLWKRSKNLTHQVL
jgi:competence protein ComEC